jgi:hypothetical protein
MLSAVQICKITVPYLIFVWHSNVRYNGIVCWKITNIISMKTPSRHNLLSPSYNRLCLDRVVHRYYSIVHNGMDSTKDHQHPGGTYYLHKGNHPPDYVLSHRKAAGLFLHSASAVIVTMFYDWSQVINFLCYANALHTIYLVISCQVSCYKVFRLWHCEHVCNIELTKTSSVQTWQLCCLPLSHT